MVNDPLTTGDLLDSRRAMMPACVLSAVVHAAVLSMLVLLWQTTPPQDAFAADPGEAATETSDGGDAPNAEDEPRKDIGRLTGGKLRTYVYGVYGEGNMFVYVFDRSESMTGKRLASAKAELIRSLEPLQRLDQFGIIFYNHEVSAFNPSRLSFGDDASKGRAERYIQGVTATGATNHVSALMHAVRLSPDVIFLLTDGEERDDLSLDELRTIRKANSGTQINVIQFVQGEITMRGGALAQLARETGGEHKFIDTQKLK